MLKGLRRKTRPLCPTPLLGTDRDDRTGASFQMLVGERAAVVRVSEQPCEQVNVRTATAGAVVLPALQCRLSLQVGILVDGAGVVVPYGLADWLAVARPSLVGLILAAGRTAF